MSSIVSQVRPALVFMVVLTVLAGGVYPAVTTALLQAVAPHAAGGSIATDTKGNPAGSELIGQAFARPGYFWGRLSATSPSPYNASGSAGSNLGVNNPDLLTAVKGRLDALRAADPSAKGPVPVDLVTASASGLDPDISPAAAAYQLHRVAQARGLTEDQVSALVAQATSGRTFGIFGEPRVNVLKANMLLDAAKP